MTDRANIGECSELRIIQGQAEREQLRLEVIRWLQEHPGKHAVGKIAKELGASGRWKSVATIVSRGVGTTFLTDRSAIYANASSSTVFVWLVPALMRKEWVA